MSAQAEGLVVAPRRRLRDNAVVLALRGSPQALFGGAVLSVVVLAAVVVVPLLLSLYSSFTPFSLKYLTAPG